MAAVPIDLRAMLDEMLLDQVARFRAMLTKKNDSLWNDITNQWETILGNVQTLMNAS
ncbi:hypothetical protein JCGZ_16397 [Jatropha curcas]|uniref:Uncharacterized protein n=1 Tax=Jatropha curcas TaxID=180498 RepID=A0A067KEM1_JATCU|nr:hypothetical protein JCGZ_16397 [Jatropha curcas]